MYILRSKTYILRSKTGVSKYSIYTEYLEYFLFHIYGIYRVKIEFVFSQKTCSDSNFNRKLDYDYLTQGLTGNHLHTFALT